MRSKSLALLAASLPLFLYADTIDRPANIEERDIQAIREWINTKRQVTVKEKGGSLSISGEVRTEMQITHERVKGVKQRGPGTPFPTAAFDVEVNLMFDYRTDTSWASAKLEFDNDAGVFSGTLNKINLERAIWGVQVLTTDSIVLEFDLGRRAINSFVDTRLQGSAFFDGILMKYDQGFDNIGDLYFHPGIFLVDERNTQFGLLGELGIFDIINTGLYLKYLFIDWDTKDFSNSKKLNPKDPTNSLVRKNRFQFITSQVTLGYKFIPKAWDVACTLYIAALTNHAAKRHHLTNHARANWGGYAGASAGELRKKGDWSVDANYQFLGAQAVPDYDVSGFGLGNIYKQGFYTTNIDGSGAVTTKANAIGNGNYHGYGIQLEYLFTNNLVLFQQWIQTFQLDGDIGPGGRRFNRYEAEFNYAF